MRHPSRMPRDGGFSLVEVLVATMLLSMLSAGAASLVAASGLALAATRGETVAVLAAESRMEQLRSLAWGFGSAHAVARLTDTRTDLSGSVPAEGGPGLAASPVSALAADTPGLVDYLDVHGRWVGNDATAASAARFVRRWRVGTAAGSPDTLVIEVRVVDRRREIADVHLVTLRTRTAG